MFANACEKNKKMLDGSLMENLIESSDHEQCEIVVHRFAFIVSFYDSYRIDFR